jgi:RNA polymerase sigma factor (sigma-70 family)
MVTKNCNFFELHASNPENDLNMEPLKVVKLKPIRLTDEEVVARVLSGEKELYEILLKRYNQTLYRTIRSYLHDGEVEDIMQEAYIKAFEKLSQFQGGSSFSTWLIRIGINEALQFLRQKKKARVINLYGDHEDSTRILNMPDASKMNPEKKLINHERKLLLEKTIGQLPEKYRIVYMLREIEGMKNPEIAACLDITESNVKVRLHRAKLLIREEIFKISANANVFEFGNSRCDRMVERVMSRIGSPLNGTN